MIIKFEIKLLSIGLYLVLLDAIARASVVKPKPQTDSELTESLLVAANDNDELVIPVLSSDPEDNPTVPYYEGAPNYPHVQLDDPISRHSPQPFHSDSSEPYPPKGDEYKLDRRLPIEEPDYYYDSPRGPIYPRQRKKPKKLMKAVERVYFYPEDNDSEIRKNKKALDEMRRYSPPSYEPYYNAEDPEDTPFEPIKKDFQQMEDNPPRADHEEGRDSLEEPDESQVRTSDPTQSSIASDVKQFGKEAVDEAHRFEKFLDNLRNFAENSEKEYASPHEDQMGQAGDRDDGLSSAFPSDDGNFGMRHGFNDDNNRHNRDADSMTTLMNDANNGGNDRTIDYEKPITYGALDDYEPEKNSYQRQRDLMDMDERKRKRKGGHRYHKDRRRGRRPIRDPADEDYNERNKEVSGLIDREPDEDDYLSNRDVVRQMRNSEKKYNVGADPVYSSQRDFDEVTRLEKMIENVALLNKEKEKRAAKNHDRREVTEESRVVTNKVKTNDNSKKL